MNESFQMEPLGEYCKIIREYEGKGLLTLYDGQTCNCLVRAVQFADGKIVANCSFSENLNLVLGCLGRGDAIQSINGITEDNDEFSIEEHIWCTSVNPIWNSYKSTMVAKAGSLIYRKKQSDTIASVRFGITNFEYSGNKLREYPNGGGAWDILSVTLGDKAIEIYEVPEHKAIMESVEAQRGIDVTSEAVVNISSLGNLDTVTPLIDTLCKLLSLARGTKINWIYYDCYDPLGEKVLSFHKNSIVWKYAALPLIDPRNPNETATFIKQAYPSYVSLQDKYNLEKGIEVYLDAKREGTYLETRALVAAVLLDFLSHRYITKHMGLRKNLGVMLQRLGITASNDDLERLTNIRNSLAHEASFIDNITKEYSQEYFFLIGTLDRIFLKILNYNGAFLDITNKFERVVNNNQS